ncbi:MAG: signal peptidase II [Phycisphaerales bacterium]|nr:MAG: signal peptidase II [Phycisphaerales bacterium]
MDQTDEHCPSWRHLFQSKSFALPDVAAHLIFWPLMFLGLGLDLWTKHTVFAWLEHKPRNAASLIDGLLEFVMHQNPGAAWGIAQGRHGFLVAVSIIALLVIFVVFLFFSGAGQRLVPTALGLFAAGVSGNLWDRLFNAGEVRDFVRVYYGRFAWPTFNVADTLLCVAVGLLVISTFVTGRSDQKRGRQHK